MSLCSKFYHRQKEKDLKSKFQIHHSSNKLDHDSMSCILSYSTIKKFHSRLQEAWIPITNSDLFQSSLSTTECERGQLNTLLYILYILDCWIVWFKPYFGNNSTHNNIMVSPLHFIFLRRSAGFNIESSPLSSIKTLMTNWVHWWTKLWSVQYTHNICTSK